MESNLKFASIFSTIQGEGSNCGKLTTFIRLYTEECFPNGSFCSFCDTIGKSTYENNLSLSDVESYLIEHEPRMVTITGGEPFAVDFDKLIELLEICNKHCEYIEIETNGSYLCDMPTNQKYTLYTSIDRFNISPKLKSSGVEFDYTKIHETPISIFKFVIGEDTFEQDIKEIESWDKISKEAIWLMPITPSSKLFKRKLFDYCVKNKYNYSPRIHIDIFGDIDLEV